jgi:asparagine synthase (glutamine-hydrolysing)
MCGIAGYISVDGHQVSEELMQRMVDQVAHRGPDGSGIWRCAGVALGHRRLSILDLSELGHQPMVHEETGRVISFNGEIYNYIELREALKADGYGFRSGTDTEVILKAYDRWGAACVERFNGMWAFAIYDPKERIVFCSRDRFGVKPFYYAHTGRALVFGSEIRQLLPFLGKTEGDAGVLAGFLESRVAEHPTKTFFSGVHKLPGGHNLIYDLAARKYSIRRFYSLEIDPVCARMGLNDATESFRSLFEDAVRLRLRSDVKVGTCLSGGLDSSSIATLAARRYRADSHQCFSAITAISEDPATDESSFARMVVEREGLDWIAVRPTYDDFREVLGPVVRAQEEPFASASIIMQYQVMRAARRAGIPVLLDGQGADEGLLGYDRYFADLFAHLLHGGSLLKALGFLRGLGRNGRPGALRIMLWNLLYFHAPHIRRFVMSRQRRILKPEYMARIHVNGSADRAYSSLFEMQKVEIEQTNLPALLRYEDKNSMWHSVETRLPFLDYRLVELVTSLAVDHKLHDGWGKFVLRAALGAEMPKQVSWRKNKFGFEAPEARWTSRHKVDIQASIKRSPLLRLLVRKEELEDERIEGMNPGIRWRLFSTALWAREFGVVDAS